jgi:hypothetical protein
VRAVRVEFGNVLRRRISPAVSAGSVATLGILVDRLGLCDGGDSGLGRVARRWGEMGCGCKPLVVAQDVIFRDPEFKVEDIEVFALDAANVALAEDACAHRPVDVLECGIVKILGRHNECPEENPLQSPLLETNVKMGLCALDVDERDQQSRHGDFSTLEHTCYELCELGMLGPPRGLP